MGAPNPSDIELENYHWETLDWANPTLRALKIVDCLPSMTSFLDFIWALERKDSLPTYPPVILSNAMPPLVSLTKPTLNFDLRK
jgi:hypothetical protein